MKNMIDFLGIGAHKAGTTWLMENLYAHPDVWRPLVKEVHYFDIIYLGAEKEHYLNALRTKSERAVEKLRKEGRLDADGERRLRLMADPAFAYTDAWYAHLFSEAPPGKIKGEFTPIYCAIGARGIAHVKRLLPDVRLLYIVRDPVDRALSALRMAVDRQSRRTLSEIISSRGFQARGDYAEHIPAWDSAFPEGQILYIPYGRIKSGPLAVMREVEAHIGLSAFDNYPQLTAPVHSTTKRELDEEVVEKIRQTAELQYAFLRGRFGEEFYSQIK